MLSVSTLISVVLFGCLLTKQAAGSSHCRNMHFKEYLIDGFFNGSVIKSFKTTTHQDYGNCMRACFIETKCVSFNLRLAAEDDMTWCELISTDHNISPGHLEDEDFSEYHFTENPCSSSPCKATNQTCILEPGWKTYRCSANIWW